MHALLLDGPPGVGKTTALARLADLIAARGRRAAGFLTRELRDRTGRVGFALEGLGGERALLARAGAPSPHRVGRYGVDLQALERVVAATLREDARVSVTLVDEIGKMECLSPAFIAAVTRLLDARRLLVATVAQRAPGFPAAVKRRPGVELWAVSRAGRDEIPARALAWLEARW